MEEPRSSGSYWLLFAAVTMIVITLAAIRWSLDHSFGTSWDEAIYINQVQVDTQRLQSGMLLKLAGRILIKSSGRPPGYRLLAVPFLALFGFHTTAARLVSLACFGLSAWIIYRATRCIGSQVAGALAVLVFSLSPQVVSASIWFSTVPALYLATSAMLYYVFLCWNDRSESSGNWIGLGLAVGLGFLSKASFVLIALPLLAFWLVVDRWSHLGVPRLASQRKAGLLALLVAAPWWLLNIKPAVVMVQSARGFVRHSLGPPSLATGILWLSTVVQSLLGYGLSILIGLVVIACFRRAIVKREMILDPLQRVALGACACAGVPIVLAQLSGTNHYLGHISPAVIPLAIAVGVLSDKTGFVRSRSGIAVSSALFCAQLIMIVAPVFFPNNHPVDSGLVNGSLPWRIMVRHDQWDWSPVQNISHSCGIDDPRISYLGSGRSFTQPAIEYPWAAKALSTRRATVDYPDVRWLWRYEEGPLDWQKVMDSVGQSDLVITAPRYIGQVGNKEDVDNQHNAELADRLSRDPRFRGPIRIQMGRFEPVEVLLFLNNSLVCHSGQPAPANQ
jgi:4-amino-4-deoxy-L-arabinose transferase-like glycosyltransferase